MTNNHSRLTDWPEWLKVLGDFINRVGFPIVAFLLLCYLTFSSVDKVNTTMLGITKTLVALVQNFESFKCEVSKEHSIMLVNQDKIKDRLMGK